MSEMRTLTSKTRQVSSANSPKKPRMTKHSKQKETILRVLRNSKSHPTATWIYDEVRKELPHISLATIYRNLRLLQAKFEIVCLDIAGDCKRFDPITSKHYHGKCDQCGQVFNIDESASHKLVGEIIQKAEFKISEYRLEFRGLCKDCQRRLEVKE